MRMQVAGLCALFVLLSAVAVYAGGSPPEPPGQPAAGYGSAAGYICNSLYNGRAIDENNAIDFGDTMDGTRCWVFIPSVLKHGATAPVVIYLHGFMAIVPPIYQGQIEHLVRQGYIVIFPEYNLGGFSGMFNDTDQYLQLDRAIAAVEQALALPDVAARAELDTLVLASHSNGGNLSLGWIAAGGIEVQAMVMQHPCVSNDAIPAFVRNLFLGDMTSIDFAADASAVTCPVIIIGGADDTIAKPEDFSALWQALPNAPSRVYYQYASDDHGDPALESDHMVPAQDDGVLPGWILDLMSGMGFSAFEENGDDFRIHYAALDAALDGLLRVPFDRGQWSDGVAVSPVMTLADSEIAAVALYQDCGYCGYFAQLPPGAYCLADLQARGIHNDDLSSLAVPPGMQATLFEHDQFGGASWVFTGNDSCFTDNGCNDTVSSIIIE